MTPCNNSFPDPRAPHERLSAMQYHVACGVAAGKFDRLIAKSLNIHRTTVTRYVHRIMSNTGFASREQIKKYANKHGVFGAKKFEK